MDLSRAESLEPSEPSGSDKVRPLMLAACHGCSVETAESHLVVKHPGEVLSLVCTVAVGSLVIASLASTSGAVHAHHASLLLCLVADGWETSRCKHCKPGPAVTTVQGERKLQHWKSSGSNIAGLNDGDMEVMRLREENEALMDSLVRTKVELAETEGTLLAC